MRKFHHNKVIDVITRILSYSTLAFIIYSCAALLIHVFTFGPPSTFGIYG